MGIPHFRVSLNLSHAATIAERIVYHLNRVSARRMDIGPADLAAAERGAQALVSLLQPYQTRGDNPPPGEAARVVNEAARLGRQFVSDVYRLGLGGDRLGQAVRNLFECLELGEEGAVLSLTAGEDPGSVQRPV